MSGELPVLRISVCNKRLTIFIHEGLTCLHTYLLFPDIAHVQDVRVNLEAPFVLKRFVPISNDVLEEQLDLSQFQVVISNSMDMCVRFQTAVLQVSRLSVGVCSSVILKCRSLINMELTQIQIPYSVGEVKFLVLNYWRLFNGSPFCDGCSIYKCT
jgi:hypothetical protein